jgi:photosystem II stability/assembly factor-like uncharacterized protein
MKWLTGLSEVNFGEPGFFWNGSRIQQKGSTRLLARILIALMLAMAAQTNLNGQQWQRLGPQGGTVITLETAMDGAVYLGTADGHIFVRERSAKSWKLAGRAGSRTDAVVSRLLADPRKASTLLASFWYQQPGAGGGVFRTEDSGRTWKLLGLAQEAVRALEQVPSEPDVLIAGTRTGVFRSPDGGKTWERISPEGDPELRNVDSLAIDPRDAKIIYAGTYHLPWKTTDGGKSWTAIAAGLIDDSDIMSLRVDAANPNRLFLSACSGIYRSENQGGQWTKLQGIPYAARRTHSIVQDLQNPQTLYAGTTEGLWVTRDSGESWERTTPREWVINSVTFAPGAETENGRVLIGTETRGVQASEDAGKTFGEYNDGFMHRVVQQLIAEPGNAAHLLMIMQHDETAMWESGDGGVAWSPLRLARLEGKKETRFAAETVQTLYASPWGWMVRLFTGQLWMLDKQLQRWSEWKLQMPVNVARAPRDSKKTEQKKAANASEVIVPQGRILEFSQENAYVPAKQGLLRCNETGSCLRLKAFARGGRFSALSVAADGMMLTVVMDGKLATSRDGGQTAFWSDLPVSAASVLWIDTFELDGRENMFLGTIEGLFSSPDKGASWKPCGQGLPAGQVERLLHGHDLLVATLREGGLYVSRDNGGTWSREDRDEQRSRFTGLVETAPGVLTMASQSEGVLRWQAQLTQK